MNKDYDAVYDATLAYLEREGAASIFDPTFEAVKQFIQENPGRFFGAAAEGIEAWLNKQGKSEFVKEVMSWSVGEVIGRAVESWLDDNHYRIIDAVERGSNGR
jgi:hypothetical protein